MASVVKAASFLLIMGSITSRTINAREHLGLVKPTGETKERDCKLLENRIGNAIKGIRSDFVLTNGKRAADEFEEDNVEQPELRHPYHCPQATPKTKSKPKHSSATRTGTSPAVGDENRTPAPKRRSMRDRTNTVPLQDSVTSQLITPSHHGADRASCNGDSAFRPFSQTIVGK